jgi:hypothetical protein
MATSIDFAASVSDWVKESDERMNAVFREATQRVVSAAQSRIPVLTGFARASVRASLSSMPPTVKAPTGGGTASYNPGDISAVLAGAKIGDTAFIGWTAEYAGALEFGHSQQAPSGFLRVSLEEWPRIVEQVTAQAKGS